jgi:hypothetical protein
MKFSEVQSIEAGPGGNLKHAVDAHIWHSLARLFRESGLLEGQANRNWTSTDNR